ncbi:MAG: alpha-N-arabinofuranosidase [Planctomycetaceae bacterium]|nr:alpha-N-arabinofuranosidase [Planctomycetaceae bacterium]
MTRIALSVLLLGALSASSTAQQATIKVDVSRVIGSIDRNLYGVFMEPIRNTMDGVLYDPDHPLANEDGFRTDYIEAARELQLTNMRWPGGNYMATYDWKDGIGPRDERPVRREVAWNVLERNRVGTDEWLALSQAMGVDNSICINGGTGTAQDAAEWIEYVNSPAGSYYADLRAENGHPEPYGVKYWHLGNEVDGEPWQAVSSTAHEYVRFAKNAANLMYFVNRGCQQCVQPVFIAMGSSWVTHDDEPGDWVQWNHDVINGLIDQQNVHYIALHRYWGRGLTGDVESERSPEVFLGDWAMHFDEYITTTARQIQIAKVKHHLQDKPFSIAFTEWSPRTFNHMSTLAGALHFNHFIRHADVVKRANFTLFISLLGRDDDGATYKSPFFHMFKAFSTRFRGESLDVLVECDTFAGRLYKAIPYLDVSSSYSEDDQSVVINVVNRNMTEAIETEIISDSGRFTGPAEVTVINAEDVEARYASADEAQYVPKPSAVEIDGASFRWSFAPHSFTQIKVSVE